MPKTTRVLSETPISGCGESNVLVTDLFYSKGGTSYLSGNYEGRGYWVAVRPEERRSDGTRSFIVFEGGKIFIEPAKAFSAKKFAALIPDPEKVKALQAKVWAEKLAKSNPALRFGKPA